MSKLGLDEFVALVATRPGDYAALASYRQSIDWLARELRERVPGIGIGRNYATWPNGSRLFLVVAGHNGDLVRMRGMRLESVLLVHGDPARAFASDLPGFLPFVAAGPAFERYGVIW